MIAALLVACGLGVLPQALEGAREGAGRGIAFIELEAERARVFVREPSRLVLRVGIEARFLEEQALQPFQRPLDLPVEVRTHGLWDLEGVRPFEPAGPLAREDAAARASFALDGALARGRRAPDQTRGGRTYRVLEHALGLLPTSPGELALPAPTLRLVYAERFGEDFISGRVPLERLELEIAGAPLFLAVQPLPEEGRPADFSGGVGRFELEAELESDAVVLGSSARLILTLTGDGDLASLQPPRLADLAGFHLFGLLDEVPSGSGPPARRLTYDLRPLSVAIAEVPPVRLAYFDPDPPGSYRAASSAPLALRVLPGPQGETELAPEGEGEPGQEARTAASSNSVVPNGTARKGAASRIRELPWASIGLVLLVLILAGLVRAQRRRALRPRPGEGAPAEQPDREPLSAFERLLDSQQASAASPEQALCAYLAARLDLAPAALVDPDLARRLVGAGLPAALAARTARLLEELVHSRYGGPAPEDAGERALGLVRDLEGFFAARPTA